MSIKSHQSCFTLRGGGTHGFSVCACFGSGAEFFFVLERNGIFIWGLYTIRADYLIREVIGLNKIINKI
jgi:hypothetical protein